MRLVCPNCEAKYEVPEDAIPETGRDVQCANCGHAWYQMRPRAAVAESVSAAPAVAPPSAPAPEPVPVPEAEPAPESEAEPIAAAPEAEPIAPEPEAEPISPEPEVRAEEDASSPGLQEAEPVGEPDPVDVPVGAAAAEETVTAEAVVEGIEAAAEDAGPVQDEGPAAAVSEAVPDSVAGAPAMGDSAADVDGNDESPDPVPLTAAPAAYAVDESVLAILREEAEREATARRAEAAKPLEVQTDLGIDAALPAAKKPVEVVSADLSAAALSDDGDDKLAGRRARLPDVEEINSTLRPSEQEADEASGEAAQILSEGRSSFRSGFLLVLTIAILGAALYISADALARAVPALAGVLEGYVAFINSLRLQLDGLMQSATVAINGSGT